MAQSEPDVPKLADVGKGLLKFKLSMKNVSASIEKVDAPRRLKAETVSLYKRARVCI